MKPTKRDFITTHLDLMGLKHDPIVITSICDALDDTYRAIDVAIAYGKHYRAQHECVELYRRKNKQ